MPHDGCDVYKGSRVSLSAMNQTLQQKIMTQHLPKPLMRRTLSVLVPLALAGCSLVPNKQDAAKRIDAASTASASTSADSASTAPPTQSKAQWRPDPTLFGLPPNPTVTQPKPSDAATSSGTQTSKAAAGTANTEKAPDSARIYPGTGKFVNTTPTPVEPAKAGEESFTINFEALDIRAVVQSILGEMLRESFTIHPQAAGTATVRYSRPIPKSELIPILEGLLRQNNLIMVREDGVYKILPANPTIGVRGSVTPKLATTIANLPPGFSVQLVPLKFAGVRDMQRLLEPYAVEPMSSVRVDELRNMVILSGTQRELRHMLEVIDLFDVDYLAGFSVGLFPMQTDVKALSADLDRIFGGISSGTGAPGPGGAAPTSGSPLVGIVRIIPIERLNGLLVITTQPKYLEEAKKWIDRLDKGGGMSSGIRLNVYQVQHGRADRLAQLLSDVYGTGRSGGTSSPTLAPGSRPATTTSGQPQQPGTPGTTGQSNTFITSNFQSSGLAVSKDVRIIPDNENNSLLILASAGDFETIQAALRQLDIPRRQVLVEVLITEVSLTDELKFGVEWFISTRNNTTGSLRNSGNSTLSSALPATPSESAATTTGLQLINFSGTDIRAVLQALGEDGRARVESAPKLLVLDNEKGTVNVGTRISVETGTTATNGNTTTTRQYIDTGVLLTVTPRINAGGRVTLDISQEVSSTDGTSANPPIKNRKAQTVVNVGSGETMALAGLISTNRENKNAGVPLLSKIPIIGALFGTQAFTNNRTELVVLITPTVVSSGDDTRLVNEELRKKLPLLEYAMPKPGSQEKNK